MIDLAASPNVNTLWARSIVQELARCGLRHAVISPGSRSTPLSLAFFEHPDITDHSVIDERSAGFFALGLSKALRLPTALLCTSGTAAANYYPAVCEAFASGVPLIVLTADRPPLLQDAGAPQTMEQIQLYGSHVTWFHQLAEPRAESSTLRYLRSTMCRAYALSIGDRPGPVHLNIPFRKPLEPSPTPPSYAALPDIGTLESEALHGRTDGGSFTRIHKPESIPDPFSIDFLEDILRAAQRPVIIAGPDADGRTYGYALLGFAQSQGIPVIAEAASQLRFMGEAVVGSSDVLLRSEAFREHFQPDLIIRTGTAPINGPMQRFIASTSAKQIHLSESENRQDPDHGISDVVRGNIADICAGLQTRFRQRGYTAIDNTWVTWLQGSSNTATNALREALASDEHFTPLHAVHELGSILPEDTAVFLSNSMPIRDFESYVTQSTNNFDVFFNRGVNGIDGILSTGLGIARARKKRTLIVTGDVAFLHDIGGLLLAAQNSVNATILLINNNGGEIFSSLPAAKCGPGFTRHFTTPHDRSFSKAAEFYGIEYLAPKTSYQFSTFISASLDAPGVQILEVSTGLAELREYRKEIERKVVEKIDSFASDNAPTSGNSKLRAPSISVKTIQKFGHEGSAPILFLHGFSRSSEQWKTFLNSTVSTERAIFAADISGHGESFSPEFESSHDTYSIQANTDVLLETLKKRGMLPVHLVGYSMGGRLALNLAIHAPDSIQSLILIGASPGIEDAEEREKRAASDKALAEGIQEKGLERFVDDWSDQALFRGNTAASDRTLRELKEERLRRSTAGLAGSLLGMGQGAQPSLWDRLPEIAVPVALIVGAVDEKYVAIARKMLSLLPKASFYEIPDAGHDVITDNPIALAEAIRKFRRSYETDTNQ